MSRDERQKATSKSFRNNCDNITTPSGKPFGMPLCEWERIQEAKRNKPYRPKVRKNLIRDPKTKLMVDRDAE